MATKFDAPQWLQLNKGGAVARLSILRAIAIQSNEQRPPSKHIDWRKARSSGLHNWHNNFAALSQAKRENQSIWYCHTGEQFRHEIDAHSVEGVRMDHTGWYCDPDGNEMCIAIVAALPHERFIAGYRLTDSGERVYFDTVYNDEGDAARAADEEARIYGEAECEYQQRFQEAQELDQHIFDLKRDVARMFKLRNVSGFDSAADYRELEGAIKDLRNAKLSMEERYSEFKGSF